MRNRIEVRATCPSCGPMVVDGQLVRCETEPRTPMRGLCELACPFCSQPILFSTAPDVTKALFQAGAQRVIGAVPFELLETHTGAPLSWIDLSDFKIALEQSSWPQEELEG